MTKSEVVLLYILKAATKNAAVFNIRDHRQQGEERHPCDAPPLLGPHLGPLFSPWRWSRHYDRFRKNGGISRSDSLNTRVGSSGWTGCAVCAVWRCGAGSADLDAT